MNKPAKQHQTRRYKEAGNYLQELRKKAGYASRSAFVCELLQRFGPRFDYEVITRIEQGRTEPKVAHLMAYQRITGASAETMLAIPGYI